MIAHYINTYLSVVKGLHSNWGHSGKSPFEEVTPERLVGFTSDISLGSGCSCLHDDVYDSHQTARDSLGRGVPALS